MKNTKIKIMNALKKLMLEYGYDKATTKIIAEVANVNEGTIFKNFKSKKGILNAIIDKYLDDAKTAIDAIEFTGNPDDDFPMLAKNYQMLSQNNKSIIFSAIANPEINDDMQKVPLFYKNLLIEYLSNLKNEGTIDQSINISTKVDNFMWINVGYFLSSSRFDNEIINVSLDQFLIDNIGSFTKELK